MKTLADTLERVVSRLDLMESGRAAGSSGGPAAGQGAPAPKRGFPSPPPGLLGRAPAGADGQEAALAEARRLLGMGAGGPQAPLPGGESAADALRARFGFGPAGAARPPAPLPQPTPSPTLREAAGVQCGEGDLATAMRELAAAMRGQRRNPAEEAFGLDRTAAASEEEYSQLVSAAG